MREIWHFSFTVSDLDEAVQFYTLILGGKCVHRQVQDNTYTRNLVGHHDARLQIAQICFSDANGPSGHQLELVEFLTPCFERREPGVFQPGSAHLAFSVDDINAEYERLRRLGVTFVSPPNAITEGRNAGGATVYFSGPDGIVHELVQPPRQAHHGEKRMHRSWRLPRLRGTP